MAVGEVERERIYVSPFSMVLTAQPTDLVPPHGCRLHGRRRLIIGPGAKIVLGDVHVSSPHACAVREPRREAVDGARASRPERLPRSR